MILSIDSTNNLKTIVSLDNKSLTQEYSNPHDQDVLGAIVKLLKQVKKDFKDITAIKVNPGPGSFTGSRVGVTIGNSLAFALNLKVNDQNPPIFPVYSQEPNITISKKTINK